MMKARVVRWAKRDSVEEKIGMSLNRYFDTAIERGLSQFEMADELGVTRVTVSKWLAMCGYEAVTTYRKRQVG